MCMVLSCNEGRKAKRIAGGTSAVLFVKGIVPFRHPMIKKIRVDIICCAVRCVMRVRVCIGFFRTLFANRHCRGSPAYFDGDKFNGR